MASSRLVLVSWTWPQCNNRCKIATTGCQQLGPAQTRNKNYKDMLREYQEKHECDDDDDEYDGSAASSSLKHLQLQRVVKLRRLRLAMSVVAHLTLATDQPGPALHHHRSRVHGPLAVLVPRHRAETAPRPRLRPSPASCRADLALAAGHYRTPCVIGHGELGFIGETNLARFPVGKEKRLGQMKNNQHVGSTMIILLRSKRGRTDIR